MSDSVVFSLIYVLASACDLERTSGLTLIASTNLDIALWFTNHPGNVMLVHGNSAKSWLCIFSLYSINSIIMYVHTTYMNMLLLVLVFYTLCVSVIAHTVWFVSTEERFLMTGYYHWYVHVVTQPALWYTVAYSWLHAGSSKACDVITTSLNSNCWVSS